MIRHLSRNLQWYSMLLVLYTAVFRLSLGSILESHRYSLTWPIATAYGAAVFVTAWMLAATDKIRDSRLNLSFYYHLVTYIICNGIALGWAAFSISSELESLMTVSITIAVWGLFLLAHYLYSRRTIKGMRRGRIFE